YLRVGDCAPERSWMRQSPKSCLVGFAPAHVRTGRQLKEKCVNKSLHARVITNAAIGHVAQLRGFAIVSLVTEQNGGLLSNALARMDANRPPKTRRTCARAQPTGQ